MVEAAPVGCPSKGEPSQPRAQGPALLPAHSESVLPGRLEQLDHLDRGAQLRDGGQGVRDVLAVLVAVAIELGEVQGRGSLGPRVRGRTEKG